MVEDRYFSWHNKARAENEGPTTPRRETTANTAPFMKLFLKQGEAPKSEELPSEGLSAPDREGIQYTH